MTLTEYQADVLACLAHNGSRSPLDADELGHAEWARGQGYSTAMAAYSVLNHRHWGVFELPTIVADEADEAGEAA